MQVEESYGYGDENEADEAPAEPARPRARGSAADLSFMDSALEDAEGDWGV